MEGYLFTDNGERSFFKVGNTLYFESRYVPMSPICEYFTIKVDSPMTFTVFHGKDKTQCIGEIHKMSAKHLAKIVKDSGVKVFGKHNALKQYVLFLSQIGKH